MAVAVRRFPRPAPKGREKVESPHFPLYHEIRCLSLDGERGSEMVILAYILAIIALPISTLLTRIVLEVLLTPVWSFAKRARLLREMERHLLEGNRDRFEAIHRALDRETFVMEDVVDTAILATTQVVAFLAGEWIFRLCGLQASRWLALPFGLWCMLLIAGGRKRPGKFGFHEKEWSWRIGLPIGWLIGTFGVL